MVNSHRGHTFQIDRQRGLWRTISVPSLGLVHDVYCTLEWACAAARKLIDRHLAEHGDAPVELTELTDEERRELYDEAFGGF